MADEPTPELQQPWWFCECRIIKGYMPPYPDANTQPKAVVVLHVPSDSFLRHSKGPHQGHSWDLYGDDYQTENLAQLAINQAAPPPGAAVPRPVEELTAWRKELRRQRAEIDQLKRELENRDDTIKYLRKLLGDVHATVQGHEHRRNR